MIPIKRYKVKYTVNGEIFTEDMGTIERLYDKIIADFNTELDDRYYWENRDIIEIERIKTPEEMKINWLEEYYKEEEKNF